ncbi:MAG: hypothetical protein WCV63_08890 [Negativicutes bacterium]|jgi:WD40 repeat protein
MRRVTWLVLALMLFSVAGASAMESVWKINLPNGEVVTATTFSPHGNRLVIGTSLGRMAIFETGDSNAKNWLRKPLLDVKRLTQDQITALAFDSAQKILAIGSRDGKLRFTDNTGALLKEFTFKSMVKQIVFSNDNTRALVLCDSSDVTIIDMNSYNTTVFAYKYFHPRVVAFGASSNEIIEGLPNAQGEIIKGNIDRNKAVSKIYAQQFGVDALTVNAANNLLVSSGRDSFIKIWNLDSLQPNGQINVTDNICALILTGDANTIIAQCLDGSIKLFDVIGCIQTDAMFHGSGLNVMALKPDGKFIAAAYANGDVCIYSF